MSTLVDLGRHLAWADAEHWRAYQETAGVLEDEILRRRLHHLHLVQQAFRWIVKADGSIFSRTSVSDFSSVETLKGYGRQASTDLVRCIEGLADDRLAQTVRIPWFNDPLLTITVAEALMQAVMHSHWHRGQNATRLRELGGEPPTTDLIVWFWKGRPAAAW